MPGIFWSWVSLLGHGEIGSSTVLAPLIPKIGSFALVMNYLEVCQQTLLSAAFLISANICYVDSDLFVCLFVSHLNCWLALLQRFTIKKKKGEQMFGVGQFLCS